MCVAKSPQLENHQPQANAEATPAQGSISLWFADHHRFTLATDIDVYFCNPQSPRQRGSNEKTNIC
jgi:IS30 family transposase